MKSCKCFAMATDIKRQEEWKRIFREGRIPIVSPIPKVGLLAGQESPYYQIDFDRVSFAEKEALIFAMAEKFDLAPMEIRRDIEKHGAPIKGDGVTLSICQIHGLAMMPDEEPSDDSSEFPDDEDIEPNAD